ncbi:MotA/TolQ/ExbB proton channel family protein [Ancylobacter oerskovii]|uniref:MotA/TolQ/ExbB proton channel family protein n=1 Tax=Ancylobacter oerskovii TaxID=459519 RepID=A0ABW4YS80_9HYPH|nr:MotA/TolQ/ExbB proton channel family protein [Ancylobacter oerskovii]MBS7545208.1 MotA/TolQ/ExbB proton channel family protein [Ancylobacter oerskovii]
MDANDPYLKLSSPRIFLVRMFVFLLLCAALAAVLHEHIWRAFLYNPGLNGVIFGVLAIGILFAFRQVVRLLPEVAWVNAFRLIEPGIEVRRSPVLLAPMAALLGDRVGRMAISQMTMRSIMESIGTRLDEGRDLLRYLTGLLVFLGLLGTFWGLIETVSSIGGVIASLDVGPNSGSVFDAMKTGLAAPLSGMGISFSSSLFGLAGSLVLGFLDLQAGQAQNRFYTDLEDWLATTVDDLDLDKVKPVPVPAPLPASPAPATPLGPVPLPPPSAFLSQGLSQLDLNQLTEAVAKLDRTMTEAGSQRVTTAMAHLAESLQGLVQHMRSEQQMVRDWVEAQAEQQKDIKKLLERLARESDRERA